MIKGRSVKICDCFVCVCVMNPSVSCCSSEERGEENSWVCENINTMSVGLETARQFHGRLLDWDWDNSTATLNNNNNNHGSTTNPSRTVVQSDSDEHKPHIVPQMPPMLSTFRHYNNNNNMGGLGFSGHHSLGILNSSRMRASFGDSNSGLTSPLLYSDMPSFAYGGCDSRSQLAQMMSIHGNKHGGGGSGVFHDIVKREDLEYQATMLNLGHRTYFSSEDSAVSRLYKRPRALPPSSQTPRCQAEGCKTDLSGAKHYHRRHKVCEFHSKAATVITGGVHQRFCQQCSRFHALSEFDEAKRSCRKRLADHNRRRRKPQPNAVSSNTETQAAAALKAEEDEQNSNKNVSGSSDTTRGLQVAAAGRSTESQGLMSAMSLPLVLQNSKAQISPNPNSASPNCNTNPNKALQQQQQHKDQCQQQQQQYNHNSQNGPNLSMGLCNGRGEAQAEYSGLELALPWLRGSGSEYNTSSHHHHHHHHHHRPSTPMDILHPIMSSEKSDVVESYSNSIQNFLPLSTSSSREMGGGSSGWNMVGNSDDQESGQEHEQQMFSLLESPGGVRTDQEDSSAAVEYLSHRRHKHHHHHHGGLGLNSKEATMQSLRPFGQSIYESTL